MFEDEEQWLFPQVQACHKIKSKADGGFFLIESSQLNNLDFDGFFVKVACVILSSELPLSKMLT